MNDCHMVKQFDILESIPEDSDHLDGNISILKDTFNSELLVHDDGHESRSNFYERLESM
jgi:hypothetical protein